MAGKIDCDQPEAFAEPPIKLPGKDARRRRIAVNEHDGRTFAGRLVDGNCAIRRVDPNRFHQPSHLHRKITPQRAFAAAKARRQM
jgi:hypothetical protein